MTSRTAQLARVYASLDAEPTHDRMWENMSFEEAMSLPVVDPVVVEAGAKARAYGELLKASLARTDAMMAPCACGCPSVFCLADIGQCHLRAEMALKYGEDGL